MQLDPLHIKLEELKQYIRKLDRLAVAFSGGVDSTFLLSVAHQVLGDRVLAITALSGLFPGREMNDVRVFTAERGIRHITCEINEFAIEGFAVNPVNRCYVCKKSLFVNFLDIAEKNGIKHLAEGSNTDDDNDYRPGMIAIKELGVLSPLKETGFTKDEIRQLSKEMNLPTWGKPSFACLASRIPYGERITKEKLKAIEESENLLFGLGFTQARVRHHGNLARIEVRPDEIPKIIHPETMETICAGLKKAGFTYVTVDLQGYRTGSMNEADTLPSV